MTRDRAWALLTQYNQDPFHLKHAETVEGVDLGITVKQRHEDVFKISVRTTEKLDAAAFCRQFGGGGHIRAAGCEIKGTLEEVREKLLAAAGELGL